MSKFLTLLIVLFLAVGIASADPFLTSDPAVGVTKHKMVISGTESIYDAKADGSVWIDLASFQDGETSGVIYSGGYWTLDGEVQEAWTWSETARPFVLGRPSVSSPPENLSLSPTGAQ